MRRRGRRAGNDRGNTLIEIVVAIALLGLVVGPVLGAMTMATKASATAQASSNVETAIINAVDRVNRAPYENTCDYRPYAVAAVAVQGWAASQVNVQHAYLENGAWVEGEACPGGAFRRGLIQRVVIEITDPERRVSRSIEVVKSNV